MMTKHYELTEAEWDIIEVVWEHEPCAAPEVQEELVARKQWTYSTVKTLMDRMVVKGLLKSEKIRHATLYRSAVSQAQAQRGEALYALKQAFNGALTPMVQCLIDSRNVSAAELVELEALIKAKKKTARS